MRRPVLVLTILAAVVATTVACASAGRGRGDPFAPPSESGGGDRLLMRVQNRNFQDARVSAMFDGSRVRVGVTPGNSNRNFEVEWSGGSRQLQAEIDLVAGGRYVTNGLAISPGDRVTLVVQPRLRDSYLTR